MLFLDDVLVYSRSEAEHKRHLHRLFELLRKHQLYARRSKCMIGVSEVEFLRYKIGKYGVYMQDILMSAILDWPPLTNTQLVRQFIVLDNFYRCFIRRFAQISQPISDLLRKNTFKWEEEQSKSFQAIKPALTSATVLAHPSPTKQFVISTDASKYAVGATLEQEGHPIAYLSHRLSNAETNWTLVIKNASPLCLHYKNGVYIYVVKNLF